MFKPKSTNSDPIELKKFKVLNVVYSINVFFIIFYLYKMNTSYKIGYYNLVLIPLSIAFFFIPVMYRRNKNFELISLWTLLLSGGVVSFLLYISGGLNAPGPFWMSVYPFIGGVLLGRRGAAVGSAMLIVSLGTLGLLGYFDLVPNFIFDNSEFQSERIFNLITFSIYNILTTLFFIGIQEQYLRIQASQKSEIENLLRILIHDVNNPMMVLDFNYRKIQTLIQSHGGLDQAQFEKPFSRIESSMKSVLSILSQTRELSALKDGKINLARSPVDLNVLLTLIVDQQRGRAEEKGVTLSLQLPESHFEILADEVILQNVAITNLLTNAIKFTPKGSPVSVRLAIDKAHAYVHVKDSGIGIPALILQDLFCFGKKTSRVGTDGERGTGYGMPLMKSYVEKMGGQVQISSKEAAVDSTNHGTEVILIFPLHIRKAKDNEDKTAA